MLNWADLVLIAILALSALVGLWRGLVVEVLSLVIWVAAFWLAFQFGEPVSVLFEGRVEPSSARMFLAFGLLFIGALVVGGLLTWLIRKLIVATGLTGTDRMLGLLFGILRGGVLASVLVLLLGFTPMPADDWWQQSRLMPFFEGYASWIGDWLPETVRQHLQFGPGGIPVSAPLDEQARLFWSP